MSIFAVRAQFVELKTKIAALEKESERKTRKRKKPDVEKNADVKDKSYQFSSENQPKRRRGKDRKRKILQAIEDHGLTEPEFLRTVVANAIEGDQKCMEHVLRALFPINGLCCRRSPWTLTKN